MFSQSYIEALSSLLTLFLSSQMFFFWHILFLEIYNFVRGANRFFKGLSLFGSAVWNRTAPAENVTNVTLVPNRTLTSRLSGVKTSFEIYDHSKCGSLQFTSIHPCSSGITGKRVKLRKSSTQRISPSNPKAFPGQNGHKVLPANCGFAMGSSPTGMCS